MGARLGERRLRRPRRRADARRRALAALRDVGLEHHADVWPATLSGGEAQRVALARALTRDPTVLLLDEPFGALDALTRLRMQALVSRLWRERGFSVVLVTHDVEEAILLADRIAVLDGGVVADLIDVDLPRPRSRRDDALRGAARADPRGPRRLRRRREPERPHGMTDHIDHPPAPLRRLGPVYGTWGARTHPDDPVDARLRPHPRADPARRGGRLHSMLLAEHIVNP